MQYWKRFLKPGTVRPWNVRKAKMRNRYGKTYLVNLNVNHHRIKRYDFERGNMEKPLIDHFKQLSEKLREKEAA